MIQTHGCRKHSLDSVGHKKEDTNVEGDMLGSGCKGGRIMVLGWVRYIVYMHEIVEE